MTTLALQRDALMPRQPGGMGAGLLLALIVHAVLVVALAFSVRWHASEPEGVEAELWAAVPQIAAPRAVEPEPQPVRPEPPKPQPTPKPEQAAVPDAQIAIEKARREKLELQKKEQEKDLADKRRQQDEQRKKELEDKRKKDLEAQKLAALREQNLKRMMGQAGATGEPNSTSTATHTAGRSASYAGRIKARIKPNIAFPDTVSGNPLATVKVLLAPDGTIIGKELIKSSGVPSWDDAVLRAIEKTEVLPRDTDGTVPSSFEIDFRPRD